MTREAKILVVTKYCDKEKNCTNCPIYEDKILHALCEKYAFTDLTDKDLDKYLTAFENYYSNDTGIKDSGNRREFETGAVRDMQEGKGRMDLLPWAAIIEISKHCEAGAKKYGEHNVDKGMPTSSLCDSAARHLAKYLTGQKDEPHLVAAAWNLLWAIEMTIKKPELVNTPWEGEA